MNKRALKVMLLCIVMVSLITFGCKKDNPEPTIDELKNLTTLPVLTYPTNNATGVPTSFTFTWDASKWSDKKNHGAFSYEILYGIDNPPTTKVSLAEGVTQYFVNGLELNKKYYVKVIALKDGIEFKESVVYNFTTETGLFPTAPTLNFPANLATECSIKPRLAWSTSTDPEGKGISYDVYLDTSTNPTTKILVNQSITSIIIPTFLEGETQYFWKVVAKDADENETASQIRSFTTNAKGWIPDNNFRNYLKARFPNSFEGDTLLYKNADITGFLGAIDISNKNILNLKGIEYFTSITELNCSFNRSLDVKVDKNLTLKTLKCVGNDLENLDVSNNIALTYLNCSFNRISRLEISKNIELTFIDCRRNYISSLNVYNNIKIRYLDCSDNGLESLNIGLNTELTFLNCGYNSITALDVSNNTKLVELWCGDNKLSQININNNLELRKLSCEVNNLELINVTNNLKLGLLQFFDNLLTSIDLSKNTELYYLNCSKNKLTILDLSSNINMTEIHCSLNYLTSLDLSKNTNLNRLSCNFNSLTSLDISSLSYLSYSYWLEISAGTFHSEYNGYGNNSLTMIKLNDALKNHQQFKDAKTKLPNMIIEVYSGGVKTCSNYDPNANGGVGSCITL